MDISVIIVNWNTKDILLRCLESVFSTVNCLSSEVWVVDNGSTDGSQAEVRRRFPEVKLIENGANLGFARANNRALERMAGRYAVLLNSDARLTQGALEAIVEFMDGNAGVGVCGPQLLNEDGTLQNSIANIPTLATELLNKSLLRRLFPGKYPGKEKRIKGPLEVESVIGACMVVRKKAIDGVRGAGGVGLLDEDFFFFLEETDWCMRMRHEGWKVFFYPLSRVYHLQGASAKKVNHRARVEYWRSRYTFFRKHGSIPARMVLRAGLFIRLLAGFLGSVLHNVFTLFMSDKARRRL
ncbi:MAG: glycosyltransferase family 2 protein, partial [Deltaproteobacteria bacterium]|nr:glycosyltransferase family 2 protein [Deltaproteobacteria bacterium]